VHYEQLYRKKVFSASALVQENAAGAWKIFISTKARALISHPR
jgi:hypothetical protein